MNSTDRSQWEKAIRQKMDELDFPFQPNDWEKLKRELPSGTSGGWSTLTKPWRWAGFGIGVSAISILAWFIIAGPFSVDQPVELTKTGTPSTLSPATALAVTHPQVIENANSGSSMAGLQINTPAYSTKRIGDSVATLIGEQIPISQTLHHSTGWQTPSSNGSQVQSNRMMSPFGFNLSQTMGCSPLLVSFFPDYLSDSLSYSWDFGDGSISRLANPIHSYLIPGNYVPRMQVRNRKGDVVLEADFRGTVVVKESPSAQFQFERNCNTYRFLARDEEGASQFQWTIPGHHVPALPDPEVEFVQGGRIPVSLKVTASNGCSSRTSADILVKIEHLYTVPNAFTPDGDGLNEVFGPVGESLSHLEFTMQVFDKNGQLLFHCTDPFQHWDGRIRTSRAPAANGVYVWKIVTRDGFGQSQEKSGYVNLYRN
jgi:gliding motility-associated-like protein